MTIHNVRRPASHSHMPRYFSSWFSMPYRCVRIFFWFQLACNYMLGTWSAASAVEALVANHANHRRKKMAIIEMRKELERKMWNDLLWVTFVHYTSKQFHNETIYLFSLLSLIRLCFLFTSSNTTAAVSVVVVVVHIFGCVAFSLLLIVPS